MKANLEFHPILAHYYPVSLIFISMSKKPQRENLFKIMVKIEKGFTGRPKKHGNSIMSARIYFMKRVKDCKDVL